MSFPHSEEGPRIHVVQYESYIFGFAAVVVGIAYGRCDAEPSIRSILYKGGSGMSVPWRVVNYNLVGVGYYDRG